MRKTFTTTIEEDIQKTFRDTCKLNEIKMNDVLEAFMTSYCNGEFIIETKIKIIKVK